MADFKTQLNDLNTQLNALFGQVQHYFSHLNQEELYCWIAEGAGLCMILVGIVLLFV